jgi:hypothetical protein
MIIIEILFVFEASEQVIRIACPQPRLSVAECVLLLSRHNHNDLRIIL